MEKPIQAHATYFWIGSHLSRMFAELHLFNTSEEVGRVKNAMRADFRLSRAEARGWMDAQRYMVREIDAPDDLQMTELNPYTSGSVRSRWLAGFTKAIVAMGGG